MRLGVLFRRRRTDQRHQDAAFLQHFPGSSPHVAAHALDHGVKIVNDILETRGLVVNGQIAAELFQILLIAAAGRAGNVQIFDLGELDRQVPHAPAAAWIRTFCPAVRPAVSNNACHAVSPASGIAAE